jgi:hypothetical protein
MPRVSNCSAYRPRTFARDNTIDLEFLSKPAEELDAWLTGLFDGAPPLVALGIAFLLGLRHASDPDHLVAVTSLVAADDGDTRGAARLGAWWGLGHASTLALIGIPLIAFKSGLPSWLESGAEKAIGVVIMLLAGTGAVVVLLLAAVPSQLEAGMALVVFAPMSIVSMAICTTVFAWLLTRRIVEPVYRRVLIPVMGLSGVMYGAWYVGLG